MEINQHSGGIKDRILDMPERVQRDIAIMLARQFKLDKKTILTKDEYIAKMSKAMGIKEEWLDEGFEYVESGGKNLLDQTHDNQKIKPRKKVSEKYRRKYQKSQA